MEVISLNYLDVVSNKKKLSVDFGEGNVLNLVYDATKLNKSNSIAVQDEKMLYIDYLAEFLSNVIVEWDLSVNGKVVELEKEVLIKLNMSFIDRIYKKIQDDEVNFFAK